ncbi:Transposase [Aphelenchoides avenae]|nr:Transposase [Aphelenchus avenae]
MGGGKKTTWGGKFWWFGGICRETRDVFLCYVEDCKATTLLPLIEEYVHEDSIIMSDQWAAYRRLCNKGFQHFTVNHSKNFVAPEDSSVHTQRIERHWGVAKQHLRERHAKHPEFNEGYLAEWLWFHQNRGQSRFEAIMRDIAAYWPPGLPKNSLEKLAELDLSDSESIETLDRESSDGECNCLGPEYGDWRYKCVGPNGPLADD